MEYSQRQTYLIDRPVYLDWLHRHRDEQIIKVISGVRRCGKSTLFSLYCNQLIEAGVAERQIISLNFEDIANEHLLDYQALYDFVEQRLLPHEMNYLFLDEVQHVNEYEKAIDSLFLKDNCDIYLTGSNAYFLSGDLATQLSGRYIELRMLPLSFKEFCSGLDNRSDALRARECFDLYLSLSSFPHVLRYGYGQQEAEEYLRDIYNTVLLNDVVARLKIPDVSSLENVSRFLMHNIGNRTSPSRIANTLKSAGTSVDQKTVDKYLRGLTDSLLLYEVSRYNIKGRQFLKQQKKYYAVDIALRTLISGGSESDLGHILENIVYLELLRRGYRVSVGHMRGDLEIDFIAEKKNQVVYFQVSASTLVEETLARELAPLKQISDNYPKYLLTLDDVFREANYEGIRKLSVLDWLLE